MRLIRFALIPPLLLATWCALGLGGKPGKAPPADGWYFDYDQARTAARQSGKPLFVVFR